MQNDLKNIYNESLELDWEEVLPTESYWIPKSEDEFIEGKVLEIKKGVFGSNYYIKDKQGFIHITPSHKILENLLSSITINDTIRIVYKGNKPTNKGNPIEIYKVYKKVVMRRDYG